MNVDQPQEQRLIVWLQEDCLYDRLYPPSCFFMNKILTGVASEAWCTFRFAKPVDAKAFPQEYKRLKESPKIQNKIDKGR